MDGADVVLRHKLHVQCRDELGFREALFGVERADLRRSEGLVLDHGGYRGEIKAVDVGPEVKLLFGVVLHFHRAEVEGGGGRSHDPVRSEPLVTSNYERVKHRLVKQVETHPL